MSFSGIGNSHFYVHKQFNMFSKCSVQLLHLLNILLDWRILIAHIWNSHLFLEFNLLSDYKIIYLSPYVH